MAINCVRHLFYNNIDLKLSQCNRSSGWESKQKETKLVRLNRKDGNMEMKLYT